MEPAFKTKKGCKLISATGYKNFQSSRLMIKQASRRIIRKTVNAGYVMWPIATIVLLSMGKNSRNELEILYVIGGWKVSSKI